MQLLKKQINCLNGVNGLITDLKINKLYINKKNKISYVYFLRNGNIFKTNNYKLFEQAPHHEVFDNSIQSCDV